MWAYGEKGIEAFDEKGNVVKEFRWENVAGIDKYSFGSKVESRVQ
jgi:hypothetical protein